MEEERMKLKEDRKGVEKKSEKEREERWTMKVFSVRRSRYEHEWMEYKSMYSLKKEPWKDNKALPHSQGVTTMCSATCLILQLFTPASQTPKGFVRVNEGEKKERNWADAINSQVILTGKQCGVKMTEWRSEAIRWGDDEQKERS